MDFGDWPFSETWSLHGNKEIVARYEIFERIGEGTFGEVFRARRREDNVIVALKEVHTSDSSWREVNALLLVDHPNVVKLYEYFVQEGNVVLVLEYLPYNLHEVIRAGKGKLTEGEVKGWIVQVLRGLAACHSVGTIHRDLKPSNLLVSEKGILKIADFGQARILQQTGFGNYGGEGSLGSDSSDNSIEGSGKSLERTEGISRGSYPGMGSQADGCVTETHTGDDNECGEQDASLKKTRRLEVLDSFTGVYSNPRGRPANVAKKEQEVLVDGLRRRAPDSQRLVISSGLEKNDVHLITGPTNVGYSVLADAVKDARNYFTVEELCRSGTEMEGLGMSVLERKQMLGLQVGDSPSPSRSELVSLDDSKLHHGEGDKLRLVSQGTTASTGKEAERDGAVESSEGRFSSDESDVDWKKGQCMIIETWRGTEESSSRLGEGTEGCASALSDAVATRWYRAPEFQYSYMDSKNAEELASGGTSRGDTTDGAFGGRPDCGEEGSELIPTDHGIRLSHESNGKGGPVSEEDGSDFTTMVGTRWYKAPELLYGATKYGKGIDIWAMGCIFGELLLGKPLFPGNNDIEQLSRVVRVLGSPTEETWAGVSLLPDFDKISFVDDRSPLTLKSYVPNVSESALQFLQKLLTYDTALRLSAEAAAEDTLFFTDPLPYHPQELQLPTMEESEASDEEWGDYMEPGSPFSDFENLE